MIAYLYAKKNNIPMKIFEANWKELGKAAGYYRNELIVKYSDELLVIWDGKSKGTKNTINLARKYNKHIVLIIEGEKNG